MKPVLSAPMDFAKLPQSDLIDDGGRRVDAALLVTSDIAGAVAEAVAQNYAIMAAGGLTSAIGSYDYRTDQIGGFAGVVAIRPKGAVTPELVDPATPPEALKTYQLSIDADKGIVAAGAGLTFKQIEAVLAEQVGATTRILVDLTSIGSAFVGGVIATGGMGPMRMRPSVVLEAVVVADGGAPRLLTGPEIDYVEGLQGWTGMVAAAVFRIYQVPPNEFGLVLPVQGSDVDSIAGLLSYLEPWTQLSLPGAGGRVGNEETLINGVELVSRDSLRAFVAHAPEPARTKAQGLLQSCDYAGADMLACITGWSEASVDDVLVSLLDPETETIGGVMIEFGVGFSSGSEMDTFRAIREGAPDIARTRARVTPEGRLKPWSTSTDINIAAPADTGVIADILTAYADYRTSVRALGRDLKASVDIEIVAYGHLLLLGIDPHHRVTVFADLGQDSALSQARQAVTDLKRQLIRDLIKVCDRSEARITGGEKGAPSLVEVIRAAGGTEHLSADLQSRISIVRRAIKAAPPNFTFRVPPELL